MSTDAVAPKHIARGPEVRDNAAPDEATESAMIGAPVSDSGAYPPACRECGDFELCVHDVGEEG